MKLLQELQQLCESQKTDVLAIQQALVDKDYDTSVLKAAIDRPVGFSPSSNSIIKANGIAIIGKPPTHAKDPICFHVPDFVDDSIAVLHKKEWKDSAFPWSYEFKRIKSMIFNDLDAALRYIEREL